MSATVLHVIPAIATRYGGPSVATLEMCRALGAAGTRTLIATTDADGSGRLAVTTGDIRAHDGVPTIFFRRQASESFKWSRPLATWLKSHVREFNVVHIHAVFSHSSIAAGRACRAAGVPYIVRPLGTLDPWSLDQRPRRKRLLLKLAAHRLLTSAAAIHYTTAEERRLAETRLPWLSRGIVVPLGVEDELFDLTTARWESEQRILLAMSRLHEKKGVDLLIDAFHLVAGDEQRHWRLVIAGDGDPAYVASLRKRADSGMACGRIEFRGWVSGSTRQQYFRSAHLFALPSQQENFGIALVEAMAAGLPAVVTPGVNLSADMESTGSGWVTQPSVEALAATLGTAIARDDELRRRGARAREFADQFRWTTVAARLQAMYEQVASSAAATDVASLHNGVRRAEL